MYCFSHTGRGGTAALKGRGRGFRGGGVVKGGGQGGGSREVVKGGCVEGGHTLSEQPKGVAFISLLAGVMTRGQTVRLQTLTQRSSGSLVLHTRQAIECGPHTVIIVFNDSSRIQGANFYWNSSKAFQHSLAACITVLSFHTHVLSVNQTLPASF